MAVINLGQFGSPRKSPLSGLADVLAKRAGDAADRRFELGENEKDRASREGIATAEQEASTGRAELAQSALDERSTKDRESREAIAKNKADALVTSQASKVERETKEANTKQMIILAQKMADLPTERHNLIKGTPGYEKTLKEIEKELGTEAVVNGKLVYPSTKEKDAAALQKKTADILLKVSRGEQLDAGEAKYMELQGKGGEDIFLNAVTAARRDWRYMELRNSDQPGAQEAAQEILNGYIEDLVSSGARSGVSDISKFKDGLSGRGDGDNFNVDNFLDKV